MLAIAHPRVLFLLKIEDCEFHVRDGSLLDNCLYSHFIIVMHSTVQT